jgi:hypothetical protein
VGSLSSRISTWMTYLATGALGVRATVFRDDGWVFVTSYLSRLQLAQVAQRQHVEERGSSAGGAGGGGG